jgi:hypothetical protein
MESVMPSKPSAIAPLCAFAALVVATAAQANDVPFIDTGSEYCARGYLLGKAAVTTTKVAITQKQSSACAEVKKVHNASADEGVVLYLDKRCAYHVRFSTTAGCSGVKEGNITVKNIKIERQRLDFFGACGTVNVKNKPIDKPDCTD